MTAHYETILLFIIIIFIIIIAVVVFIIVIIIIVIIATNLFTCIYLQRHIQNIGKYLGCEFAYDCWLFLQKLCLACLAWF